MNEEQELESSAVSLAVITEQHIARREAGFAESIRLPYVIMNDDGEHEDRLLVLRRYVDIPRTARRHHANMNYEAMLGDIVEDEGEVIIFLSAKRPGPGRNVGPKDVELRAIWEIAGVEYSFFDAAGLNRLDATYERFREAQRKQRRMLNASTKKIEAKPRKKKKSGKAKP